MKTRLEWKTLLIVIAGFLACFYLPVEWLQASERVSNAVWESLHLVRWYAREHVILCLVPAFFIAGAIAAFLSQQSIMKYLGAKANKVLAYGVASASGTILAVCSCTVLPLFAGIYRMGAGLGPATTFLYAGPAINILAIILTARVLGLEMGIARAVGAIVFSIIIGLAMHFIFRKEELAKAQAQAQTPEPEITRPLWQNGLFFAAMVGVLVFSNWAKPDHAAGIGGTVYQAKWLVTSFFALGLGLVLALWFKISPWKLLIATLVTGVTALLFPHAPVIPFIVAITALSYVLMTSQGEAGDWFDQSWAFLKQILPLLLAGVLFAGAMLGRPGHEGLIPSSWITQAVGGNSLGANFFAAIAGAFMYFATLTEVPILQGLIGAGMGKGPALALLLAGPALSLPNMLVIRSVMGTKKTIVFVILVVLMATLSGITYGALFS